MSPAAGVVVTATNAKVQTVTVSAGGKQVAGALDDTQAVWKTTGALAFNQTYTVTATALDADGKTIEQSATFTTVKPTSTVNATFQANSLTAMKNGSTYGVGQPVILHLPRRRATRRPWSRRCPW